MITALLADQAPLFPSCLNFTKSKAKLPLKQTFPVRQQNQPCMRAHTKPINVVTREERTAVSPLHCCSVNAILTRPTQEHPWSGCQWSKRQLSVCCAVRRSENAAEETRALPDGAEHRGWSVGGQLMCPVQQVIAQDTGRAKLALVQSGTRVGHAEVEGRRRDEERFGSVPVLLLVLQRLEVFFQFYSTWMRFFASFLDENTENVIIQACLNVVCTQSSTALGNGRRKAVTTRQLFRYHCNNPGQYSIWHYTETSGE